MIIGLGIDIVEISRIKRAFARQGKRFLNRIFTEKEISYARQRPKTMYQHLAARFAAKEAFLKAIGTGWGTTQSPKWKEIEVQIPVTKSQIPILKLSGKAQKVCQNLKVHRIHLSLSHTSQYALAEVLLER